MRKTQAFKRFMGSNFLINKLSGIIAASILLMSWSIAPPKDRLENNCLGLAMTDLFIEVHNLPTGGLSATGEIEYLTHKLNLNASKDIRYWPIDCLNASKGTSEYYVTLKWEGRSDAKGYNIYRKGNDKKWIKINDKDIFINVFNDSDANIGEIYEYCVYAEIPNDNFSKSQNFTKKCQDFGYKQYKIKANLHLPKTINNSSGLKFMAPLFFPNFNAEDDYEFKRNLKFQSFFPTDWGLGINKDQEKHERTPIGFISALTNIDELLSNDFCIKISIYDFLFLNNATSWESPPGEILVYSVGKEETENPLITLARKSNQPDLKNINPSNEFFYDKKVGERVSIEVPVNEIEDLIDSVSWTCLSGIEMNLPSSNNVIMWDLDVKQTIYLSSNVFLANGKQLQYYYTILATQSNLFPISVVNSFSPDNDGINEILYIKSKGVDTSLKITYFKIENINKELMFLSKDSVTDHPESGWSGLKDGYPAPAGEYFYEAAIDYNGKLLEISGVVELIRQ